MEGKTKKPIFIVNPNGDMINPIGEKWHVHHLARQENGNLVLYISAGWKADETVSPRWRIVTLDETLTKAYIQAVKETATELLDVLGVANLNN